MNDCCLFLQMTTQRYAEEALDTASTGWGHLLMKNTANSKVCLFFTFSNYKTDGQDVTEASLVKRHFRTSREREKVCENR